MVLGQSIEKNNQKISVSDFSSTINFDVDPKISIIKNNFFNKGAEFCFSLPNNNVVCVSKHFQGLKVFIIESTESKIIFEFILKGKLGSSQIKEICVFDESNSHLYIGLGKTVHQLSFRSNQIRVLRSYILESDKDEKITFFRYEKKKEHLGFWLITDSNVLYFIEIKEQAGFSDENKLWKIRLYLKKENKVLVNSLIEATKSEDGSLFVLTKETLFCFRNINTKIFLADYINFSTPLLNGKMYVNSNIVTVVADNKEGLIALLFNKTSFQENTSFWAFQNKSFASLGSVEYHDNAIYIADKDTGSIQKINIFMENEGPIFNTDPYWNKESTNEHMVVSEMLINSSHLFCVVKSKDSKYKLKAFSAFDGKESLSLSVPVSKLRQKLFMPNKKSLYLLSNDNTVIIHGKEILQQQIKQSK